MMQSVPPCPLAGFVKSKELLGLVFFPRILQNSTETSKAGMTLQAAGHFSCDKDKSTCYVMRHCFLPSPSFHLDPCIHEGQRTKVCTDWE